MNPYVSVSPVAGITGLHRLAWLGRLVCKCHLCVFLALCLLFSPMIYLEKKKVFCVYVLVTTHTMWVLRIRLRFSGFVTIAFTHRAISLLAPVFSSLKLAKRPLINTKKKNSAHAAYFVTKCPEQRVHCSMEGKQMLFCAE